MRFGVPGTPILAAGKSYVDNVSYSVVVKNLGDEKVVCCLAGGGENEKGSRLMRFLYRFASNLNLLLMRQYCCKRT